MIRGLLLLQLVEAEQALVDRVRTLKDVVDRVSEVLAFDHMIISHLFTVTLIFIFFLALSFLFLIFFLILIVDYDLTKFLQYSVLLWCEQAENSCSREDHVIDEAFQAKLALNHGPRSLQLLFVSGSAAGTTSTLEAVGKVAYLVGLLTLRKTVFDCIDILLSDP